MLNRRQVSRRQFLASSTKNAAAVGVGAILASSTAKQARAAIGANDRIRVALVGCGMRGKQDLEGVLAADNVICTGLCDVAEVRQGNMKKIAVEAMEKQGHTDVQITTAFDHRELLDRKDIDAIIDVTPDHWHLGIFVDSLEAGKHVYQEKPMSYSIEDGVAMVAAAKKHPELTVQVGMQRRSSRNHAPVKAMIDEGKIGKITYVHAFDTRNWVKSGDPWLHQPYEGRLDWDRFQGPCNNKRSFDKYRYLTWRWFWDYAGGLVTDVGIHVMDIVHLLTSKDTPKSAVCNGGLYGMEHWETPDVVNVVWDYGSHSVLFTGNFTNRHHKDGLTIYGTKGTVELVGSDYSVWEEGNAKKPIATFPGDQASHQGNWIDCIRSGKTPNAPVEVGFRSLVPSLIGNLAFRRATKITWDADAKRAV